MTIKEALKKSGTLEALPGAAIDAADQMIEMGEKVRCAVAANCSVADMWANGILAVTSHRVLFCSGTGGAFAAAEKPVWNTGRRHHVSTTGSPAPSRCCAAQRIALREPLRP